MAEDPALPLVRPPLRIDLGTTEVKMTYGLEMDLRRLLPDATATLQLIMHDPYTQDYVVRRCLTNAKKMILKEEDLIPANEVELTSDQTEELLMWATEHVLFFFVNRATSMEKLGARFQAALPPTVSSSGSTPSPSTTPSAGPSE